MYSSETERCQLWYFVEMTMNVGVQGLRLTLSNKKKTDKYLSPEKEKNSSF